MRQDNNPTFSISCFWPQVLILLIIWFVLSYLPNRKARSRERALIRQNNTNKKLKDECLSINHTKILSTRPNNLNKVQSHFSDRKLVSIRGTFSTGTNWVRELIRRNCPSQYFSSSYCVEPSIDADGLYGWKHGFFLEKEIAYLEKNPSHKLLILFRHPLTWAVSTWKMKGFYPIKYQNFMRSPKMRKAMIKIRQKGGLSFEEYISLEIFEEGIPTSKGRYFYYYYNQSTDYQIISKNVFQARQQLYENWMKLKENSKIQNQIILVRYEDLLLNPFRLTELVECENNITLFDPVRNHVKYGAIDVKKESPQAWEANRQFCMLIQSEDLYTKTINLINKRFELEVLNYTFPDTLEEFCGKVLENVENENRIALTQVSLSRTVGDMFTYLFVIYFLSLVVVMFLIGVFTQRRRN
jgi:hypothetical protein